MTKKKVEILDHSKIEKIIERIANQILENYFNENEIVIVGIDKQGYLLAQRFIEHLSRLCDKKIRLFKLKLDKDNPLSKEYEFDGELSDIENKNIVLVDDVLNSGKTLAYALRFLMRVNVKQIFSTVLIDRIHRRYPVRADFVGMTLSTTLQDHISVKLGNKKNTAFVE